MTDLYYDPNSNHSRFEQAFLHAVRAIMDCDDGRANGALNEARRQIQRETPAGSACKVDTKWLESFYGDYLYDHKAAGPWIRSPEQLALIAETVKQYGNEKDVEAYNNFIEKIGVTFKRPVGLILKVA